MRICIIVIEIGDIRQHAVVCIHQDVVGVHPEHIGQVAGTSSCLQLGPVLVPAGDLHLDGHIGVDLMIGIRQGLHGVTLGGVPNLHGQSAVRGFVAASTGRQAQGKRGCKGKCSYLFPSSHHYISFQIVEFTRIQHHMVSEVLSPLSWPAHDFSSGVCIESVSPFLWE